MRFTYSLLASLTLGSAIASPVKVPHTASRGNVRHELRDGRTITHFEDPVVETSLEIVTNSGLCETTPGVGQKSGYVTVGSNMNMFFWFFEARNAPTTAPLAIWLNGGPGCSSMIGLFQENGPCHFVGNDSTPTLNPYSWNNYANMLYVDEPVGAGFSYGDVTVNGTVAAAPYVWKLLQSFYTLYPEYESRDFGLFTESYGGHYGPEFADYFEQQNAAIAAGKIQGEKINLVALGINNGWFDALVQYKAYIDFAYNNTYRALISKYQYTSYMQSYTGTCAPAVKKCQQSGTTSDCKHAQSVCQNYIEGPISNTGDFDVYDVREPSNDPYPPATYSTWINTDAVKNAIGAKTDYQQCGDASYNQFSSTGDSKSRNVKVNAN
jgi:carboxypeptidase C (cathepsin A)